MCVQRFDDSQSSAIRITYRISLRSSSFQKPRYPSPIVVSIYKNNSNFLITLEEITQNSLKRLFLLLTKMILPQVHLRKPCYDFTFL